MNALSSVGRGLLDVLRFTFVRPVQEGGPRPRTWQAGQRTVAAAVAVTYVILLVAAASTGPLRSSTPLTMSMSDSTTLPTAVLPVLLVGSLLSLVLVHCAAIHVVWWVRIALLAVGGAGFAFFSLNSFDQPVLIAAAAGCYLALLVFIFVRAFSTYRWWEFVVVAVLLTLALFIPWLGWDPSYSMGLDRRVTALQTVLTGLAALSLPALIVAGCAPAQIMVAASDSIATRHWPRGVVVALFVIVLGWWGFEITTAVIQGVEALDPAVMVSSGIWFGVTGLVCLVLWLRSRRETVPAARVYANLWDNWLYPLAMLMSWLIVLLVPLVVLRSLLPSIGLGGLMEVLGPATSFLESTSAVVVLRLLVGCGTLVWAWFLAGRRRLGEAMLLGAFGTIALLDRIGSPAIRDFLTQRSPLSVGLIALVIVLIGLPVQALRKRLTPARTGAMLSVLLLGVAFKYRDALDDPISTILGAAGLATVLFGLVWSLVTDAEFTHTDGKLFPVQIRIYLYLANALFAITTVSMSTLSRLTESTDQADWLSMGDYMLGWPLFLVTLIGALWMAFGPGSDPDDTSVRA